MANILIKCPKTGELVRTGINMDPESLRSSSVSGAQMTCSECGGVHTWGSKEAVLDS